MTTNSQENTCACERASLHVVEFVHVRAREYVCGRTYKARD